MKISKHIEIKETTVKSMDKREENSLGKQKLFWTEQIPQREIHNIKCLHIFFNSLSLHLKKLGKEVHNKSHLRRIQN